MDRRLELKMEIDDRGLELTLASKQLHLQDKTRSIINNYSVVISVLTRHAPAKSHDKQITSTRNHATMSR